MRLPACLLHRRRLRVAVKTGGETDRISLSQGKTGDSGEDSARNTGTRDFGGCLRDRNAHLFSRDALNQGPAKLIRRRASHDLRRAAALVTQYRSRVVHLVGLCWLPRAAVEVETPLPRTPRFAARSLIKITVRSQHLARPDWTEGPTSTKFKIPYPGCQGARHRTGCRVGRFEGMQMQGDADDAQTCSPGRRRPGRKSGAATLSFHLTSCLAGAPRWVISCRQGFETYLTRRGVGLGIGGPVGGRDAQDSGGTGRRECSVRSQHLGHFVVSGSGCVVCVAGSVVPE